MKVILLENIKGLGVRGDQVKVAAGHGRNYLIPNKLALLASGALMPVDGRFVSEPLELIVGDARLEGAQVVQVDFGDGHLGDPLGRVAPGGPP